MPVFATEIYFDSKIKEIAINQQFQVDIFLNTENEAINAIEGKVVFPEKFLELKEIRDGNSIINFWIERPQAVNGEIIFSGIIPGGYLNKEGLIFSLVFQSIQEGRGQIEIRDIKTLINDGQGTETKTTTSDLQFVISKKAPISPPIVIEIEDTDLPETFEPAVASDPTMFEGKYFLVFATQDKGSGIDHYEVQENRKQKIEDGNWEVAQSPYVLKDQELKSFAYVKAVDKKGNERIVSLSPRHPLKWYKVWWIWVIIILAIIFLYFIRRFL